MQPRINLKTQLGNPIINHINHGKISMLPRTHTQLSETSQLNIFLNKNQSRKSMSLTKNSRCQDHLTRQKDSEVMEGKLHPLLKKRKHSIHHHQKVVHSKREMFQLQNSDDIMIVGTCQLELTIKVRYQNQCGKFLLKVLTIIIIFLYFLTVAEKNQTLIVLLRLWAHTIFLIKAEVKFCLSFHN